MALREEFNKKMHDALQCDDAEIVDHFSGNELEEYMKIILQCERAAAKGLSSKTFKKEISKRVI